MKMGEMILDCISSNRLQIYRKGCYTEKGKRIHPRGIEMVNNRKILYS
jgi:hypothetical protein